MDNVVFYGGQNAGMIGLLTLLSMGFKPRVISEDYIVTYICNVFNLEVIELRDVKDFDLFVCVHGKKIIPKTILDVGICINVHPCLYKYKGSNPISRLLKDNETKASVGCHLMTEVVDSGRVIDEIFVDVSGCNDVVDVYNKLYPFYSIVLLHSINKLQKELKK